MMGSEEITFLWRRRGKSSQAKGPGLDDAPKSTGTPYAEGATCDNNAGNLSGKNRRRKIFQRGNFAPLYTYMLGDPGAALYGVSALLSAVGAVTLLRHRRKWMTNHPALLCGKTGWSYKLFDRNGHVWYNKNIGLHHKRIVRSDIKTA